MCRHVMPLLILIGVQVFWKIFYYCKRFEWSKPPFYESPLPPPLPSPPPLENLADNGHQTFQILQPSTSEI